MCNYYNLLNKMLSKNHRKQFPVLFFHESTIFIRKGSKKVYKQEGT